MLKLKKCLFFLLTAGLVFGFTAKPVLGITRCEPQYGGGEICREVELLILDKKVRDNRNDVFYDHLPDISNEGYHFVKGEEVVFRLRVKNESDKTFSKVTIIDTLPKYLKLRYHTNTFEIYDLKPGQTEIREVFAYVDSVPEENPEENTVDCVENIAEAWGGDEYRRDTSTICISNKDKVLGVKILPKTGPSALLMVILASIVAGFTGLVLVRLNRKP